jgi:hypothetical protein
MIKSLFNFCIVTWWRAIRPLRDYDTVLRLLGTDTEVVDSTLNRVAFDSCELGLGRALEGSLFLTNTQGTFP